MVFFKKMVMFFLKMGIFFEESYSFILDIRIVFLIFVLASLALGRNNWTSVTDVVFDALGLAYFFQSPS